MTLLRVTSTVVAVPSGKILHWATTLVAIITGPAAAGVAKPMQIAPAIAIENPNFIMFWSF